MIDMQLSALLNFTEISRSGSGLLRLSIAGSVHRPGFDPIAVEHYLIESQRTKAWQLRVMLGNPPSTLS